MLPIQSFILKATGFCNLNCSYCYMFNLNDRSYLARPRAMSEEIVQVSAGRIRDYAVLHGLKDINIIIHGGEPLLAGADWFRTVVNSFRSAACQEYACHFAVQTNGVLLTSDWLELFRDLGIVVALSMDGPPKVHNRNRFDHSGRGSYERVVRGLNLLLSAHDSDKIFGGVLCVVDPREDGLSVYRHFRELGVPRLDFLFPLEHNWDNLPPYNSDTPFADYLVPIFDDWWKEDNPQVIVRLFYEILLLACGARRHVDSLGGDAINLAVIETNGDLEPLDALRSCADGLTATGLNILHSPLDSLHDQSLFRTAMAGKAGLCDDCKQCPLTGVCGGGYLPNRYSQARGFDNRSVYCRDLWRLITHVLDNVLARELRHPLSDVVANDSADAAVLANAHLTSTTTSARRLQ